jgi:glycosyltransferase involved in cell wall biosynthesis
VFLTPLTLLTEAEETALRRIRISAKPSVLRKARKRLLAELDSLSSEVSVTLIQRQADLLATTTVERRAIADRPLVYDVDDAIWFDRRQGNGSIFAFLKGSQRKARWLARRAEHVIAGNDILAEYLGTHAKNIEVIPSVVDTASSPVRKHADGDELTIGWIGSHTTAPYVNRLSTTFWRLAHELKPRRVRLLMVGGDVRPPPGVAYEFTAWSIETERDALKRIDIGIMPQPDTPWTRGKCAYKAIQYMAAGIPVVADDVGVTHRVVAGGGRVIRNDSEWLDALLGFARQAKLRAEFGDRGRRRAESDYSVERWGPRVADVLRSVV